MHYEVIASVVLCVLAVVGVLIQLGRLLGRIDNCTDAVKDLTSEMASEGKSNDNRFLDHEIRLVKLEALRDARNLRAVIKEEDASTA
jgi:hypothetical protein